MRNPVIATLALCLCTLTASSQAVHRLDGKPLTAQQIDATVEKFMTAGHVPGLALALIENGKPVYVKAYGYRNVEHRLLLQTDTIMYAASTTKLAFAYMVMQLRDEGIVDIDKPIATYLKKPLPEYPKYADLANDDRWKKLTIRMLLDHTSGFPNFRFLNDNGKLDFKFDPGTRYAYSGEGINLAQFVLEEGLGLDVGKEIQRRVFDRFGMTRTSMTWRDDFTANAADGYDVNGKFEAHHQRGSVRAAGSMDTTIHDYANFLAGFVSGEGLSSAAKAEMLRPQIAIHSASQFPTLDPATNPANDKIGLASGIGLVISNGPYGKVFYKGGHDEWTDNQAICVDGKKQCILLYSNSMLGETIFPALVKNLFGETGLPWQWEYNPNGSPAPVQ